jgi:hypothetical protein
MTNDYDLFKASKKRQRRDLQTRHTEMAHFTPLETRVRKNIGLAPRHLLRSSITCSRERTMAQRSPHHNHRHLENVNDAACVMRFQRIEDVN